MTTDPDAPRPEASPPSPHHPVLDAWLDRAYVAGFLAALGGGFVWTDLYHPAWIARSNWFAFAPILVWIAAGFAVVAAIAALGEGLKALLDRRRAP